MKRRGSVSLALAIGSVLAGMAEAADEGLVDPRETPFAVLVFSKTAGFRHASIPDGVEAIRSLGAKHGFEVEATEDAARFTDEGLAGFGAVVFLSTTGDVLDPQQETAFERYVGDGGGFVGIHAAADTEYDWPWFGELVGGYFQSHPPVQDATVVVTDRTHPSTAHLPPRWERTDEWYNYRESPRGTVHVLAALDERTYTGGGMGHDHPIAWCHQFMGGRAWYTGGGHTKASFAEPLFLDHILGGIRWAAGVAEGDAGATIDRHYAKVVLDDQVADPMELAIAQDGAVVFVERGGAIKVWRPETRASRIAGVLDVFTGLEDGLLGVALDPQFTVNGWVYLYYSPRGPVAENVLSRFTMEDDRIAEGSEVLLLTVPTQRDECCHSGGSLAFDGDGNLLLSTGDNTSPFASDGFAPIDERAGRSPFDAQKSSANTDDLRGKILRITPQPDGTYAIPKGNLFPADGSAGLPEIYAMGCRNPFRISVDRRRGWVYFGDVGPDAGSSDPGRGPAGHDEFNRVVAPGNFGWPYCIGDNRPYRRFDFETRSSGAPFDPAHPVNDSSNSDGARSLPPAQSAWMSYPYADSERFPQFGSGERCAMAGPVYHADPAHGSPQKLPESLDDTVFLYEWGRGWIKAVRLDAVGEVLAIDPFLPSFQFARPHDLELGPDGCLYLIEWGSGFGGGNRDAQIVRVEYYPSGERPPFAAATADRTAGPRPLTVRFSGDRSRDRSDGSALQYAWDFDGDGRVDSRDREPVHTYDHAGDFDARLTVTASNGLSGVDTLAISAGNTPPAVTIVRPVNGGFAAFGDFVEFEVVVVDDEDGPIDPARITVQPLLGHDTHAHPLQQQRGSRGEFQTLRDDGHGGNADLFTVLAASYTDDGGEQTRPLHSKAEVVLQPKRKQAEHASAQRDVRIQKAGDPAGGGQAVVFDADGSYVAYRPVHLGGIESVTLRVTAASGAGELELRVDSPTGPLLGRAQVPTGATVDLQAGPHPIRVEYFQRTGGAGLILRIEGGGLEKMVVPAALLSQDGAKPGLLVKYYELDGPDALPDFGLRSWYAVSTVDQIDFPSSGDLFAGSGRSDQVGAVFSGYLTVPVPGAYTLSLESDDGSRLFLDSNLIVDNDGLHAMVERSTDLRWHDVTIPLADPGGTRELYVVFRSDAAQASTVRLNWMRFNGRGVTARTERVRDRHDH